MRSPYAPQTTEFWIEQTDGAQFWMKVLTELKKRGCEDILSAVTDGLKGMTEAIDPATTRQTGLVHLLRQRLDWAGWKERKALAAQIGRPPPPQDQKPRASHTKFRTLPAAVAHLST